MSLRCSLVLFALIFASSNGLSDILGDEDRFMLSGQFGHFSDMGGQLTMTFADGKQTSCTGSVIGKEWVLAASHCVYDYQTGEAAQAVTFDPARVHKSDYNYPREYASSFWILKKTIGLVQSGDSYDSNGPTRSYMENDFAVIRFPTPKGRKGLSALGYPLHLKLPWEYQRRENPLPWGTPFTVDMQTAGYPSDKESGTYWFTSCNGELMNGYNIYRTYCDAVPGQSGSAVVQAPLAGSPDPTPVIGVVSAVSSQTTYVAALTQRLLDEIHGLIGKTEASYSSFKKFDLKRKFENRLFVNNNCDRTVSVYAQYSTEENGETVIKAHGWNLPAGAKGPLFTSTYTGAKIFLNPKDRGHIKLYRQVMPEPWEYPTALGPEIVFEIKQFDGRFAGYDFDLGKNWTDSKLIIECK